MSQFLLSSRHILTADGTFLKEKKNKNVLGFCFKEQLQEKNTVDLNGNAVRRNLVHSTESNVLDHRGLSDYQGQKLFYYIKI